MLGRCMTGFLLASALVAGGFAARVFAQEPAPAPEASTGRVAKTLGVAKRHMVAAANPLAAEAGRGILREGGSAVDAFIATQFVLNLVEPQSSGIGGGAFLVHWDRKSGRVTTLDGRETAPAAAKPDRFMGPDGKPMGFMQAAVGGRSVGVPGTLRLMEEAHRRWGTLPWARLVEPALQLAEKGFSVSPRLSGLLSKESALKQDTRARGLFYGADGEELPVGHLLKNPAFGQTLRRIGQAGALAFYEHEIARDIVETVTGHPSNPGDMTLDDLKAYRVIEREPVCGRYRRFMICGMGPPSSGGVAVQQILSLLEGRELARPGPEAAHWIAEAGRLAFADRNLYLADPDFLQVPVKGLLDETYLKGRAQLISPDASMGKAEPGQPVLKQGWRFGASDGTEFGTSHISIVDEAGDAVAVTTTIEDGFGARLMTKGGFLLNNELTDFSFAPEADGKAAANRVEGGKRPRSSMAPTLAFDDTGALRIIVGSPGGSQIIPYVVKTLVALIDWKMDPQTAVDYPNFGSRNGPTEIEKGTEAEGWTAALRARGHEVRAVDMTSGAQAILVTPEGLLGGADFRREGVAIGD